MKPGNQWNWSISQFNWHLKSPRQTSSSAWKVTGCDFLFKTPYLVHIKQGESSYLHSLWFSHILNKILGLLPSTIPKTIFWFLHGEVRRSYIAPNTHINTHSVSYGPASQPLGLKKKKQKLATSSLILCKFTKCPLESTITPPLMPNSPREISSSYSTHSHAFIWLFLILST